MSKIWEIVKREPARFFAALSALVTSLINGLIIFDGWHPTMEQLSYANGFVGVIAAFLMATILRGAVTPNVNIDDKVHDTIVELSKI